MVADKVYEFRKLTAGDIIPMVRIVKKIGLQKIIGVLQPEMSKFVKKDDESMDEFVNSVGQSLVGDLIDIVLDNLETIEADLFKLLGDVSELGVDGVRELPLDVFGDMLVEFIGKEEFPDFFTAVSRFASKRTK